MAPRLDKDPTTDGGLNPDTFLDIYRQIRASKRQVDKTTGEHRALHKKLGDAGCNLVAFSIYKRLEKMEEDEAKIVVSQVMRMAGWTGFDLGIKQGTLFDLEGFHPPTETATEQWAEAQAEERGYRTGLAGERGDPAHNPFEAGSAQHAAFSRGWNRGQADKIAGAFGKRGRPPKEPTERKRNGAKAPPALADALSKLDAAEDATAPATAAKKPKAKPAPGTETGRRANRAAVKAVDKLAGDPAVH